MRAGLGDGPHRLGARDLRSVVLDAADDDGQRQSVPVGNVADRPQRALSLRCTRGLDRREVGQPGKDGFGLRPCFGEDFLGFVPRGLDAGAGTLLRLRHQLGETARLALADRALGEGRADAAAGDRRVNGKVAGKRGHQEPTFPAARTASAVRYGIEVRNRVGGQLAAGVANRAQGGQAQQDRRSRRL